MAYDIGATIGLNGEAEYRKAISEIVAEQKRLTSEFKKATSAVDENQSAYQRNLAAKKALNEQIDDQKARIAVLNKAVSEATEKYGENSKVTQKWQTDLNNAQVQLKKLEDQVKSFGVTDFDTKLVTMGQSLEDVGKKMTDVGNKISSLGDAMTKSVTVPIAALGAGAISTFNDVDGGLDTITQKTGATGEALDSMAESMENIATSIPTDFETAGNAIGEVNIRFGATGQQLEDLSSQFIKFAQLNDQDVTEAIDSTQKALSAFGLGAEDASAVLDAMNAAGQASGISMSDLESQIVQNATAFQGLGMDIGSAIAFLSKMEKSGVEVNTVLQGMSRLQLQAGKDGKTMAEELETALSSQASAIDVFGKSGAKLYASFQSGALSVDDFTGSLGDLESTLGSVSDTMDATIDPTDNVKQAMNQLKIVGADIAETIMPQIADVLTLVSEKLKDAKEWWDGLSEGQQGAIVKTLEFAAAAGPVISIIGKITMGISSTTDAIGKVIEGIGLLSPQTMAFIGIAAGVSAAIIGITAVIKHWGEITGWVSEKWQALKDTITGVIDKITKPIDSFAYKLKHAFDFKWELPKIKLPHFSIKGKFSLTPPSVPHLSVSWYKKAYQQAIAFNTPTVLPTASGLKGFGDGSGAEIVIGQDMLMSTIRQAVGSTGNNVTVNVYPSEGMNEEQLARYTIDLMKSELAREGGIFQ